MSIKSILVPLNEGERGFNALETAFIVAGRFGGHVNAVHVRRDSSAAEPYLFGSLTGALKETVVKEAAMASERDSAQIETRFRAACDTAGATVVPAGSALPADGAGVTASFESMPGRKVDVLIDCARLNDVTAITAPELGENTVRQTPVGETLESIMLGSGRPVLVVPREWQAKKCEHAVIGWNDSVQSSRAVAMTVPWLTRMQSVTAVVARERLESAELLKRYLATHQTEMEVVLLNRGQKTAGEALLERCAERRADFLVVGGYSRARPRQLLFGGVTRHLLKNTDIVTVMVH
jgi:nucleotide-binding universal stress UspA family protein